MKRFGLLVGIVILVSMVAYPASATGSRISLNRTTADLSESGGLLVVEVSLDEPIICSVPEDTCDVTVNLASSDTSRATLNTSSLNWLNTQWSQVRSFTVTTHDDGVDNPSDVVTITTSPAVSNSEYYSGFNPADLVVTLEDAGGTTTTATAPAASTPSASLSSSTVSRGAQTTVSGSGFKSDSDVTVTLHSTPTVLGTAHTDSAGAFSKKFTIPNGATVGSHEIVVTGLDALSNTASATATVSVAGLANTGSDSESLALLAVVVVALGAGLWLLSRKRSPITPSQEVLSRENTSENDR